MSELVNQTAPSVAPTPAEMMKSCFYFAAFTDEEKHLYEQARRVDALDEELVLLRVKIFALVSREPNNMSMLLRSLMCLNQLSRTNVKVFKRNAFNAEKQKQGTLELLRGIHVPIELVEKDSH